MKNYLLILSIILTSACAQLPTTPPLISGNGLEITNFVIEPSVIYSGSNVRLILDVENKGGATIRNISSLIQLTGSSLMLYDSTGFFWYNPSETDIKFFDKDMRPANSITNTAADTKRFSWILTAPNVSLGQVRTDTFTARLFYDYETSGNGVIWVYSSQEADAIRASGRSLNTANFSIIRGPLSMNIRISPSDPVVLFGNANKFSLFIDVSNVGGGTVFVPGGVSYTANPNDLVLLPEEINKIDISFDSPGLTITGCTGIQELQANRDTVLVCSVVVNNPPVTSAGYSLQFSAKYGYIKEASLSARVSGV